MVLGQAGHGLEQLAKAGDSSVSTLYTASPPSLPFLLRWSRVVTALGPWAGLIIQTHFPSGVSVLTGLSTKDNTDSLPGD